MTKAEFEKKVDSIFYDLANMYFSILYGTNWYENTIKPYMINYSEDTTISKVYKDFLQKNKNTITEKDSEVCMNLIFNDYFMYSELGRMSGNTVKYSTPGLHFENVSGQAKKLFEIRRSCLHNTNVYYSEWDFNSYINSFDYKDFFCGDIMPLITDSVIFKSYSESYHPKLQQEYDNLLVSTLKKYQIDVQIHNKKTSVASDAFHYITSKIFSYTGNDFLQYRTEINAELNNPSSIDDFFSMSFRETLGLHKSIDFDFCSSDKHIVNDNYNTILETIKQISCPMSSDEVLILLSQNLINSFILYRESDLIQNTCISIVSEEEKRIKDVLDKFTAQKNNNTRNTNKQTISEEKTATSSTYSSTYLDTKKKIEEYFMRVEEYMKTNRLEDAATNVRHILELIVNTYVNTFSKENVFLKTFDKIEKLKEQKIINEASVDTLHGVRKIANKGAHGDSNGLTFNEINLLLLPLKKEARILYNILETSEKKTKINSNDLYDNDVLKKISCPTCNRLLHIEEVYSNKWITCSICNSQYILKEQTSGLGYELRRNVCCENCKVRLSVPVRDRKCIVTCGNCHHEFVLMPDGSQQSTTTNTNSETKRRLFKWFKK